MFCFFFGRTVVDFLGFLLAFFCSFCLLEHFNSVWAQGSRGQGARFQHGVGRLDHEGLRWDGRKDHVEEKKEMDDLLKSIDESRPELFFFLFFSVSAFFAEISPKLGFLEYFIEVST